MSAARSSRVKSESKDFSQAFETATLNQCRAMLRKIAALQVAGDGMTPLASGQLAQVLRSKF